MLRSRVSRIRILVCLIVKNVFFIGYSFALIIYSLSNFIKMKKRLIALFAATILLLSTTFANTNIEPSLSVQTAFNRLFKQPTEIKWEMLNDLYKVSFVQSGQYLTAFFNPSGRVEAVSRNISTITLPLILQKRIEDKLPLSWVSECFELFGKNGTEYYVTIENADEKILYKATGNEWIKVKTTRL